MIYSLTLARCLFAFFSSFSSVAFACRQEQGEQCAVWTPQHARSFEDERQDESCCCFSVFLILWSLAIDFQGENGSKIAESRWIYNVSHHLETERDIDSSNYPLLHKHKLSFRLSDIIFSLFSFLFPPLPFGFCFSSLFSGILRPLMSECKLCSHFWWVFSVCLSAWLSCWSGSLGPSWP